MAEVVALVADALAGFGLGLAVGGYWRGRAEVRRFRELSRRLEALRRLDT